jgi:hypothetical protein
MSSEMRQFDTGATRNTDLGKLDYEGFLHPSVLKRYAQYLSKHQTQADGKIRESDNWQKGIPQNVYMKSMFRHFMDMWECHRGSTLTTNEQLEESICAVMFNAMGYLFEHLRQIPAVEPCVIQAINHTGEEIPAGTAVCYQELDFKDLAIGDRFYWLGRNHMVDKIFTKLSDTTYEGWNGCHTVGKNDNRVRKI